MNRHLPSNPLSWPLVLKAPLLVAVLMFAVSAIITNQVLSRLDATQQRHLQQLTSAYLENFIYFGWGPQRQPDGSLAIVSCLGDVKMPVIAVEDIGKCALGVFKRGSDYIGKSVGVAGDHVSGMDMAAELSSALGQSVGYNDVPADVYRSFGFPGADDVGNMFQFKRDCNEVYRSHRSVEESRRLNPDLQTLRSWLQVNAARIPIPA